MPNTINQRMTVEFEGDFVVLLIGMRINRLWQIHKWFLILIGLLIAPLISWGQLPKLTYEQYNTSGMIKLKFIDKIEQADSLSKLDIARGTPFLLLQSGISPQVYASDSTFENKYKVYYYDSGCTGPREKFAAAYNKVTFAYLKHKYGGSWKREIRKDVIGFRNWK